MSKLFYDNLLDFSDLKRDIDDICQSRDEREELWKLVDEIIHFRVLNKILDSLEIKHHPEFIEYYHKKPHDEMIHVYLKERIGDKYGEVITSELLIIKNDLRRSFLK